MIVRLDEATRAAITARQQMIAQQTHILRALQLELESFVSRAAGVDLAGEQWELDLAHGLLTRLDAGEGAVLLSQEQHKLLERKESADNGE
jgi:hypothetical protein